jgi:hypothetical protein
MKSYNASWSCQGKMAVSVVWPARWGNTLEELMIRNMRTRAIGDMMCDEEF